MSTLYDEVKDELEKYGRIIELYSQLKKLNEGL